MYDMTQEPNRLPAPYELNTPQVPMDTSAQSFARGGRASKHGKMTKVHMNPHELRILDHLQGGPEYGHEGIKVYSHLEELLKNPHIVNNVHKHAHQHRQRRAQGGLTPAMQHLRAGGRYGDTEIAAIGPHTHRLFNELAGHSTRNPHTGHPEYFSIGDALGGIWNTVKGVAAPVLNIAKGVASPILGMLGMGGGSSQKGGASSPDYLAMAQQALGGLGGGATNPYLSAIGQAAQSYMGGASPSEAFGQGMRNIGSQMGGGFGNALAESGQALSQGRGLGESLKRGAQRGYDELGGTEGLYNAASNIGQGLMQGGFNGARQAAGNEMSQYAQGAMPKPANVRRPVAHHAPQPQEYDAYEEYPYQDQMYG